MAYSLAKCEMFNKWRLFCFRRGCIAALLFDSFCNSICCNCISLFMQKIAVKISSESLARTIWRIFGCKLVNILIFPNYRKDRGKFIRFQHFCWLFCGLEFDCFINFVALVVIASSWCCCTWSLYLLSRCLVF